MSDQNGLLHEIDKKLDTLLARFDMVQEDVKKHDQQIASIQEFRWKSMGIIGFLMLVLTAMPFLLDLAKDDNNHVHATPPAVIAPSSR